jgi:hypothetical protein
MSNINVTLKITNNSTGRSILKTLSIVAADMDEASAKAVETIGGNESAVIVSVTTPWPDGSNGYQARY